MATQNFINECKNRANANRLGKFVLKRIPEEYTQVDYIESSGTQYIELNKKLKKNQKVVGEIEFNTLGNQSLFGTYGDTYYNETFGISAQNKWEYRDAGSNWVSSNVVATANTRYNIELSYGATSQYLKINGTNVITSSSTHSDNVSDKNADLFARNNNGTPQSFAKIKLYSWKMYDNNILSLDLIPCYRNSDNEVGLYDIVNKTFYANEGTGSFTYGNISEPKINQTNYLVSMTFKDSCYVDNTIIGSLYTRSADIKLLNLPANTELVGKTITPEVGVRYANDDTEYIQFDDYVIESPKDEQTASNTEFTAMNGGALLEQEYKCNLSFENGETHTINEFYQDACSQLGLSPLDATFDNSEIELTGNPFQNKESLRVVIQEVEKVSCSIANISWFAHTITLRWLSDQIDYEFNTSDYSTLEGSLEQYGPVNVVILGNSQLDGENVTMTDAESVAEYGEHQIMIDSPYFLYTEELRNQAIQAIYDKLDGLTYYDLTLTTPYGKPFLKIGDKIRINTNENQVYDTYVLTHTFTFDGTFKSIIESPALTSEEQKIKNEYKGKSITERLKRTEVIVDKTTGEITSITQKVEDISDEFGNYCTIEQANILFQEAETGVTNMFSEAGGNNIFRNTGLWFENTDNDRAQNPYEFWTGVVERESEEKAANRNALKLKANTLTQSQIVPNGNYTVSFKYNKLLPLSTVSVKINDVEYELTGDNEEKEFLQPIVVNSQGIQIDFISDTDNACLIYDLMVNAGNVKLAYSQNQNETTTDTVNISKGITITSSDNENIVFKANYDGVRIYDKANMTDPKTKFTDKGMTTKEMIVEDKAQITGLLFQQIGSQVWISKI